MSKKTLKSFGHVRIISGCWRGKKLLVPNIPIVRPTTNFMRETLFNWLSPVIYNSHCLDCFAGSGALGFEAISRGASSVLLLENNPIVVKQLIKNLQLFKSNKIQLININTLKWLSQSNSKFNIVFIDAPFYYNIINQVINLLEINQHLTNKAWIYIETKNNKFNISVPKTWKLFRLKIIGQVLSYLYIRNFIKINENN